MSLMRGAGTCRAFASAFAVKPATGRTAFLKLIHSSASVIVNDFDVLESRRCPAEADAPKTEQAQNLRWSREWSHFPDPPPGAIARPRTVRTLQVRNFPERHRLSRETCGTPLCELPVLD